MLALLGKIGAKLCNLLLMLLLKAHLLLHEVLLELNDLVLHLKQKLALHVGLLNLVKKTHFESVFAFISLINSLLHLLEYPVFLGGDLLELLAFKFLFSHLLLHSLQLTLGFLRGV